MINAIVRSIAPRRSPELQVSYAVPLTDPRVGSGLYTRVGVGVRHGDLVELPGGRRFKVYEDESAMEV
jgi:hypothetical protein